MQDRGQTQERMPGKWATLEQTAGGLGEEECRQQGGVKKQFNLVN